MGKFLIPFLLLTMAEVYLMKEVAERTGYPFLLGFVILTGIIGINLAKRQGRRLLKELKQELASGAMPSHPIMEGLMILIAGAVLITPGFLTDFFGWYWI